MIYRIAVGNTSPETLASFLADAGFDGTAFEAVGFTDRWGREPSAVAIVAGPAGAEFLGTLQRAAADLAKTQDETCAYVDNGTDAVLVYPEERLDGGPSYRAEPIN